MCSIFGVQTYPVTLDDATKTTHLEKVFLKLLKKNIKRGRDAFGLVLINDATGSSRHLRISDLKDKLKDVPVAKRNKAAYKIVKKELKATLFSRMDELVSDVEAYTTPTVTILANCRAIPTNEFDNNQINQPYDDILPGNWSTSAPSRIKAWAVHNGTIANDQEWLEGTDYIDSKAIPVHYAEKYTLDGLIGSVATAVYDVVNKKVVLARNYCPLDVISLRVPLNTSYQEAMVFASEMPYQQLNKCGDLYYKVLDFPANSTLTSDPQYDCDWGRYSLTKGTFFDYTNNTDDSSAVVILSGGLDSTTVAQLAIDKHENITLVHFLYGCKAESKEVHAVKQIHSYLKDNHPSKRIDLEFISLDFLKQLGGSSLTEPDGQIVDGVEAIEYASEWVPFRNGLMVSMMAAYCDRHRIGNIYLGANLEEAGAYGDNQLEFFNLLEKAIALGSKMQTKIHNPLAHYMKHEIVSLARQINAPIHLSWSCYRDGPIHCGTCGPCLLRHKAHSISGLSDNIEYSN